jgi:glycosyltransferase involved in cell wall biosynthesis
MRIAIQCQGIVPTVSCGVENFAYGLIGALAEANAGVHELHVTIPAGTVELWRSRLPSTPGLHLVPVPATASLASPTVSASRLPGLRVAGRAVLSVEATRRVLRAARLHVEARALARIRPDIVYYPFHFTEGAGSPAVVTVHDLRVLQPEFRNDRYATLLTRRLRSATAVVTSWPHPHRQLLDEFPWLEDRLHLIPFPPMLATDLAVDAFVDASATPMILYPAGTAAHKNHVRLLQAVARILEERPVRLVCTGATVSPGYGHALAAAKDLGIEHAVEFAGFVTPEKLASLYRQATLVAIPSLWEAASGPIFEAIAYNKAVACSDVAPIRAQVEHWGLAARLFDPYDVDSIAAGVRDVLVDPRPFEESARVVSAALGELSWSQSAERYLAVFEQAARA